jgi:uncharacterized protein (TIGR02246 family)
MDPVQVVQEQVDAFNARDVEGFVSFYAPDAVIQDGAGNVTMRGRDGIRGAYGPLFAQSPELHVDILKRIHFGSWVIFEEQVTGFNLRDLHRSFMSHARTKSRTARSSSCSFCSSVTTAR